MLDALTRNWWVVLIRGLCAIVFGLMAFAWPGVTILVLVTLYGAYALVDGITEIAMALTTHKGGHAWWAMILAGIAGIAAGIITFARPGVTEAVLLLMLAIWSIVRGIFEVVAAIRLRKEIENEWLLGLAGVMSVLFGIALLAWPIAGLITIAWIIGANAFVLGIFAVALSLRLRGLKNRLKQHTAPPGAMPV